ncbi:MAG: PASTA domain-containing protein [Ruminococcaceae bacterium]|nr:PASTA domain-containing protein [Oscillospiraceae bacterium]
MNQPTREPGSFSNRDSLSSPFRPTDIQSIKRGTLIGVAIGLLFALLLIRILLLQTVGYEKYQNKVINQLTTEAEVVADRGKIYDTNGVLLATNITTYRVFIAPRTIEACSASDHKNYADKISQGLSEILDVTYESVMKQTTYTKYLDRTVARNVDAATAAQVEALIDKEDFHDMVFLQAGSQRYYPYGTMACHALGFTGSDGVGQYGLELQYNSVLAGTNGKYITARDSHGNEMPYEYQSYIEAKDGSSIVTTLDVNIQAVLEEQLHTTYVESGGANRATGIVINVKTAEILAMATYPNFNLNQPRELNEDCQAVLDSSGFAEGTDEYMKLKQELQLMTWSNKAVTEVYMPGSTFKIVTASMAYEENLVKENEHFYCPGYHVVMGRRIRCHKTTGHGSLTFAGGLQQSCNPILMMMGARIGQENFYRYFQAFGYLEKTGVDLPGEGTSIFYREDAFSELDLATSSFGQNFKISPIQQIMAVTAVANGGYLMTPRLVKEIRDTKGNVIKTFEPEVKRQIISSETAKMLAKILEEGVSGDGGAKNAYVAGYRVAAKTGTSEKIDKKNEMNDGRNYYVCSCVGFAPADDPEIAVLILVDEPTKGVLYGSYVAAPYVANVMEQVLPYLGVEAVYTDKELAHMAVETPYLVGWSVSAAKKYAADAGFEVEIVGEGSVIRNQSPAAGVEMESDRATLILYTQTGATPEMVAVPDLLGKTAVAANETLASRDLNIRIQGTNNYLSGTGAVAIAQNYAPGTMVEKGTVITVTFRNKDEAD